MTHRNTLLTILLLLALTTLGALFGPSLEIRPPEPERVPDGMETALLHAIDVGVPTGWVLQTAWLESRFQEGLIGGAGEVGIFQLHPRWNPGVAKATPQERAIIAVDLLATYRDQYGQWDRVRFAYRAPAEAARRWRA